MTLLKRSHRDRLPGIDYSIIDFASTAADPHGIQQRTAAWLDSAEMANLLAHFGYTLKATGLRDRLQEAERISRDIFDFRRGGERWEAQEMDFPPCTADAVEALVARIYREPLGLPATELGEPTHCLVMGGRITSCLLRAELLAELLGQGLRVGHIWGLGSHRPMVEMERQVAAELELGPVAGELDAVCAALRHALALPGVTGADVTGADVTGADVTERSAGASGEVRRLAVAPVPVAGLAAERGPGHTRATTGDTYRFFLRTAENVTARDHILVITSAIDAPFQHVQALAELSVPTGATITSVGAHIGTSRQAAVRTEWTTAQWLQEIRSAIWSMSAMYATLLAKYPDLEQPEKS